MGGVKRRMVQSKPGMDLGDGDDGDELTSITVDDGIRVQPVQPS